MEKTEFIKMNDFVAKEAPEPDALLEQVNAHSQAAAPTTAPDDHDELLKLQGM